MPVDRDIERIAEDLRKRREEIQRQMDDSADQVRPTELLDRIEALKQRIEMTRSAFRATSRGRS